VEQKDANGIDRVQRAALANADGSFVFCPLPAGIYDVVIVGTRSDGAIYEPSIITGVSVGSTTGTVQMFALASAALSSSTLNGAVTSQNGSNAATVADVELSVLETVNAATYTIPLAPTATQNSATLSIETAAPGGTLTCPANTDCANYSLQVSSGAANVGAWTSSGTMLNGNVTLATYKVDGAAFVPSLGGVANCSPSELASTALTLAAGGSSVTVDPLAFTGCQ